MLCPKCGKEYEGSECPNCSGPKIIVNQSDYQKRKEAYEKKQAELKSASSYSAAGEQPQKSANTDNKASEKNNKSSGEYEEINYLEVMKKVCDTGKGIAGTAAKKLSGREINFKKYIKPAVIILILFLVIGAAGTGIYRLATRKNYELYMSSNQKIYNVAGFENNYVCDMSDAVFAVDNKTFYTPAFPSEIDKTQMISSMASANGEYFAAVIYHEGTSGYALYVWKEDGSRVKCISENAYFKDIKYITNKGKVIYTDAEVLNDEGAMGQIQLYVYDLSEKLILVEQSLREAYVYAGHEKLICHNKENELYVYDYEKMSLVETISEEVSNVYIEAEEDNFFTSNAGTVNALKSSDAVIYGESGKWYYYDLAEHKNKYIAQETDAAAEFVYEEKGGYVYMLFSDRIAYREITSDDVKSMIELDTLTAQNYVYQGESNTLIYINSKKELCCAEKSKITVIDSGVESGSLSQVENTNTGFTYLKGQERYYCESSSAKPVKIYDGAEQKVSGQALLYKNKLYFYTSGNLLYTCSTKGKNLDKFGEVERFWLGTEYK
ncbi:MAG: hypothetical protein J5981_03365 [Lachnospira sp.]|nr:hypothetical protein [Lachnospira sp.]